MLHFIKQHYKLITPLTLVFGPIFMLMGGYFYFQGYLGLAPCPLCSFQRGGFILVAIGAIITLIGYKLRWVQLFGYVFSALSSIIGMGLAGRHLWLQNLDPADVPSCGPDLAYMLQAFPIGEVLKTVFTGSGDCAEILWSFMGLSIPGWSMVFFIFFFIISVFGFVVTFKIKA